MRNKNVYFLSIGYIAIYAMTVKFVYPELDVAALATVISLFGISSGLITHYIFQKITKTKDSNNEKASSSAPD